MLESLEIGKTDALNAAVIYVNTPRSQIQTEMESAITELMETVKKQGIGPAGPLFAHHTRQLDTLEFEVGVPVSGPVKTAGRVKAGQLPVQRWRAAYIQAGTKVCIVHGPSFTSE